MKTLRVGLVFVLGVAAVAAGVQAATGAASKTAGAARVPVLPGEPGLLRDVNFVSSCGFSHRNQDDPIVFPGKPGLSHDHTYFGNNTTNASSTLTSMLDGTTTCRRPGDTAGYWVPTLFSPDGTPVRPLGATIYYRRRTFAPVAPFPPGLKMIAGNSHATGPQSTRIVFWSCGVDGGVPPSADIPTCPGGRQLGLRLHIRFPGCWNGRQLDSSDHMSHMAYAVNTRCPFDHPISVPQITLIVNYGIAGGSGYELSSGGQETGHADFFNAWNQAQLETLVNGCLNMLRHCGGLDPPPVPTPFR